jgi:TonB-dependent receptor
MHFTPRCLVVALLALLLSPLVSAATVTGRIRDANTNSFLLGATITLRELNREVVTDREGNFTLHDVPAGSYTLVASYLGYSDVTQPIEVASSGGPVINLSMGAEVVQLGSFVVEGNREGQARALQQKRTADNVMEIVAADSLGKLPDGNAGEAVRRLPGVFAEIDQNEGRYIVVRGIDAGLNNITIDGISAGSPEAATRGAAMDAVPADLISRIEVVKAVTPDMDHSAIGASVNIVTPSAFDRKESFFYGTIAGGYNHGNDHTPYNGSATYGRKFGAGERWGVVVGASYSYRHYNSHRMSTNGSPWTARNGFFVPTTQQLFLYDVERERSGVKGNLEFRPTPATQLSLRASFNRFQDREARDLSAFDFASGALTNQTATSGTFAGGRASIQFRGYLQRHTIANYALSGKHTAGPNVFDFTLSTGLAEKLTPSRIDWEFRSAANAFANTYNTSSPNFRVTPVESFYNPASYPFRRVRKRADVETEDLINVAANMRHNQQILGREGFWQVGGRYLSRDKLRDRTNSNFLAGTGANLLNLGQTGLSLPAPSYFEGSYRMTPLLNVPALEELMISTPRFFVPDPASTLTDSNTGDYHVIENIGALYGMGRVNFGKWNVLAGVRMERTDADFAGNEMPIRNGVFQGVRRVKGERRYTDVLPGIHVRGSPMKDLVLRAAWTNTIARPNYNDLSPSRDFDYTEITPGLNTGSLSTGNPGLKPYESMNFDVTAEYYLRNAGIAAVSVFHKRIDNPIYSRVATLGGTTGDGVTTTFENLRFDVLNTTRPENAERGEITGIEFNYQQQLRMLPSPFDGLGFALNYTLTDSEVKAFSRPRETLPFFKQADDIGNAAIFYEKYGFEVRVAWSRTGEYLTAIGADADGDVFQREREIIDAKISYRLNKRLKIFADVINLRQEPLEEYIGRPERGTATEKYWWTATFGVNWNL